MNNWLRHIFFVFSFAVYSLWMVNPYFQSVSTEQLEINKTSDAEVYLTDLSKVLFPQNTNDNTISYVVVDSNSGGNNEFLTPVFNVELQQRVLFFKESQYQKKREQIRLEFSKEDIIYPFHEFL